MSRATRIIVASILSMAAFWIVRLLPPDIDPRCAHAMVRAGQIMEQAILAIRNQQEHVGAGLDLSIDPNRTGLIGPEYSPLVTTLGELSAKRSTTNPNFAGFLVYLLYQAGVRSGDSIAIASSGSFPSLLVASLAAAKAMDVTPITILSLGASAYGASNPDFTLLDVYYVLQRERVCSTPPAAVSIGGDRDIGLDLDPGIRSRLLQQLRASGMPLIHQPDLEQNVAERMRIYERAAPGKLAAFINSGGGYANLGTSQLALEVRPGLNKSLSVPPARERGVLFEMAIHKVPVIHLLYVKGLVSQAGLPWDPIPLPRPGIILQPGISRTWEFWLLSLIYFALLFLLMNPGDRLSPLLRNIAHGSRVSKDTA